MRKRDVVLIAAVILAVAGTAAYLWIGSARPPVVSTTAPPERAAAELRTRALLNIVVAARQNESTPETRWLQDELRLLLMRGRVPMAQPLGPYAAGDGAALFTLRIESAPDSLHEQPLTLMLIAPDGGTETAIQLDPQPTRLAMMTAIATRVPDLLPRGNTGVDWQALLGTREPASYDALAEAQIAMQGVVQLEQTTLGSQDTPIDRLERLTRADPAFARGWSALALGYLRIVGEDAAALTTIAERTAQHALELDAQLPEAHAVLGIARQRRGEWIAADESFTAALKFDAAAPAALEGFGCLLLDVGRLDYAELITAQAAVVVPASDAVRECHDFTRLARDGVERAVPPPQASASIARRRASLLANLLQGNDAAVAALFARDSERAWLQPVLDGLDAPEQRPAALKALTQAADELTLDPTTEILVGMALGQTDFVFNRMLRLHAQGRLVPTRFLWLKDAGFVREHPRFGSLVETLGLLEYWREREPPDYCRAVPEAAICRDQ